MFLILSALITSGLPFTFYELFQKKHVAVSYCFFMSEE